MILDSWSWGDKAIGELLHKGLLGEFPELVLVMLLQQDQLSGQSAAAAAIAALDSQLPLQVSQMSLACLCTAFILIERDHIWPDLAEKAITLHLVAKKAQGILVSISPKLAQVL